MKVAGITDVHDNLRNLERLIENINFRGDIDVVINCGDLLGRTVIDKLAAGIRQEQYVVFSGPDQKDTGFGQLCLEAGITCFYDHGQINVGGKRIGFAHDPNFARMLSGCDIIFYGHLHDYRVEKNDGCLFVCCGEIMGRRIEPCYAVYDTDTGDVEKVPL